MSSTTIVFNADAANFLSNLSAMKKSLLDNGDAVSRTKAKIIDALQQATEAALRANKSQQELDRIQTKGAQELAAVTERNYARIEAAIDRRMAKERAVAAELAKLGRITVPDSGGAGHGFTDRMAVSSLVRTANGNPGIRTIENTLTLIPGLASAAQGLAPLIGVAGLTGLFVEMGERGYEAFEKIRNAAKVAQRAFDEVHEKNTVLIDDLEIQNQKIQDQIAKLSGHPENGVALALLEAKKRADELLVSLRSDRKELEQLFNENQVGFFAGVFTGTESTGTQQDNLLKEWDTLQDEMHAAKTPADRHNKLQNHIDSTSAEITRLQKEQADSQQTDKPVFIPGVGWSTANPVDNSAKIRQLRLFQDMLATRQTQSDLGESIATGDAKLGGIKQGLGEDKEAEKRLKAMEAYVTDWQLNATVTSKAIFDYWELQKTAFTKGSTEFAEIERKQLAIAEESHRAFHEAITKLKTKALKDEDFAHVGPAVDLTGSTVQSARELTSAYGRAALATAELQAQTSKARVEMDLADGSISKLTADQRLAAIATDLHAQRIADLNAQMKDMRNDPQNSYNPILDRFANDHTQGQYLSLKVALDKETSEAVIDQMRDTAKLAGDTWFGALKDANARWVQDAQDTAQQVAQLYQQAINGLNQNLVNGMFGDKTDWSGMFKGIGKTIAGDGLKHLEAAGLKSLGVAAKADGSKANPYYVIDASGPGAKVPGLSGLGNLFGGGDGSESDSGSNSGSKAGGFIGGLVSFASMFFGGGKALGGPVTPGMSYDVGEFGRERFTPSVPGVITPHNQLGDGAAHYTLQVANGVAPEQMHMYVQAALREFHPRVVRDSVSASIDRQARMPSSRT